MREILSKFLSEKAKLNSNLYVFSGDHGYALFDELRKTKPNQFINAGVSEQAMVGYAAGMVKEGMKVFVYGLSAFVPIRVLEFIKMDVCYENLPVIFLGDGAGLVYATLGASHQCAEDIGCLRTLPNMRIYSPADPFEMKACLEDAYSSNSPCYIRIGKADKARVHNQHFTLIPDQIISIIRRNSDTCIISTGSMLSVSLELSAKYNFSVFSAPILTNLDSEILISEISSYKNIISIEEHSINGGLGSILSEILSESGNANNQRLLRIGIQNRFTQKCGSYEYAIKEHGLDFSSIEEKLKQKCLIR